MTRRFAFVLLCAAALSGAVVAQERDYTRLLAGTSSTFPSLKRSGYQERIALSVAETVPANQNYRIERVTLTDDDPGTSADEGTVFIQLIGVERPVGVNCLYSAATSPTGTTLLIGLNKANLSSAYNNNATTGSLKQRINHRLVVMGESTAVCGKTLTGSLTGNPQ